MTPSLPKLILHAWNLTIATLPESAGLGLQELSASPFLAVTRIPGEFSIVCEKSFVPENALALNEGWRCLEVEGPLDFALTGILAPMATILAHAKISIFALSSFNTDFILVKQETVEQACKALSAHGYGVRRDV